MSNSLLLNSRQDTLHAKSDAYIYYLTIYLQGRRAIAVKLIDNKLGKETEGYFHEKKISLLTKEDKIEEDFAKQVVSMLLNHLPGHRYMGSEFLLCNTSLDENTCTFYRVKPQ